MTVQQEMTGECRVHVVDDDDGFRQGLMRILNASGLQSAGYRCAGEFLLADCSDMPGCIILDLRMPGPNGIELIEALARRESALPVIFVTACDSVSTSVRAMRAGAVDFLVKPIEADRLMSSVRYAITLDLNRRSYRRQLRELRERYAGLTQKEQHVLAGIANGKFNHQLAAELNICERTIKAYRAKVMSKMGTTSLAGMVKTAKMLGLVASADRAF
jgi:FixJ family two-component response regulator